MSVNKSGAVIALLLVAACGSSGSEKITVAAPQQSIAIESKFVQPDDDGTIGSDFVEGGQTIAGMQSNDHNAGYAFELGATISGSYVAVAGLLPTTMINTPPDTGSVNYDAQYRLMSLNNIREGRGELHAFGGIGVNGDITLTANFDDGTLTGAADTDTNVGLIVDGMVNGSDVSGTVTFQGVEGPLTGLIDSDQVVGAFHGNSDTMIYAGGIIGTAAVTETAE